MFLMTDNATQIHVSPVSYVEIVAFREHICKLVEKKGVCHYLRCFINRTIFG